MAQGKKLLMRVGFVFVGEIKIIDAFLGICSFQEYLAVYLYLTIC